MGHSLTSRGCARLRRIIRCRPDDRVGLSGIVVDIRVSMTVPVAIKHEKRAPVRPSFCLNDLPFSLEAIS